jgi:hypothetical protein
LKVGESLLVVRMWVLLLLVPHRCWARGSSVPCVHHLYEVGVAKPKPRTYPKKAGWLFSIACKRDFWTSRQMPTKCEATKLNLPEPDKPVQKNGGMSDFYLVKSYRRVTNMKRIILISVVSTLSVSTFAFVAFANNNIISHPNSSVKYNENPAPIYTANDKIDVNSFISEEKIIENIRQTKAHKLYLRN